VVRQNRSAGDVLWNPDSGVIDIVGLENHDAVVHLAGENIASGRWTPARKERIRDSRVKGTQLLAQTLAKLKTPPKVLVSASAIGYYGDRGAELLTEESPAGVGFLSDVCQAWERATEPAAARGIRVACMRTGIVLSTRGGALAKMLPPFRLGAGGNLGSGGQYMSWISLRDLCRAFSYTLNTDSLKGPVNAVAPTPVTNAQFTKTLGGALHRPTIFPVPAFGARLVFGEMADALLLSSTRVVPSRLQAAGFHFEDSDLFETLQQILVAAA
jgi:uncharacterized protein (TIGR01777 family)